MSNSIAAVFLTKNEEKHIERCLKSLKGVCDDIVVGTRVAVFKNNEPWNVVGGNTANLIR